MTKFTINVVLREDKKDSQGLCPLAVVITINRKRTYKSLGIKVKPHGCLINPSKNRK